MSKINPLIIRTPADIQAAINIDFDRKGFVTHGKEHEGRLSYERGIIQALSVFQEAHTTADPETIVLAVYTFISQELQFCEKTDKDTLSSLTKAIQSFDWKARRIPRQYNKFLCQ